MKQFTLPKSERLYLRESIGELFANGRSFMAFPYRVVYLVRGGQKEPEAHADAETEAAPSKQAPCAIMTIAPKKRFKHAVDRNHVKRLTREAYRLQKLPLLEAVSKAGVMLEAAFIYVDGKFITSDETHRVIGKAIGKLVKAVRTEADIIVSNHSPQS